MRRSPGGAAGFAARAGALFALALLACAAVIHLGGFPSVENDAVTYLELARHVARGDGFTENGVTPHVYRPPLFPGLLGLWFALTGTSSPLAAAWFQALLHGLGVVAALRLFTDLRLPRPWATAGAAFLAINPVLVTRVVFVLPETAQLLFVTLAALAGVRLLGRAGGRRAALAGCAWGLCALAKVVFWLGAPLLAAVHALARRPGAARRRREALLVLVCAAATVLPWTARNYARFSRLIPVNGQWTGLLEWKVANADIPGEPPGAAVSERILRDNPTQEGRRAAFWRHVAGHPRHFLVDQVLHNAAHFAALPRDWWIHVRGRRPHHRDAEYWLLFGTCYAPLYLALLVSTGRLLRGGAPAALVFLALLYWSTWAQYALTWGDSRYNVPLYPLLVALALTAGGASARDEDEDLGQAERAQQPPAGGAVQRRG